MPTRNGEPELAPSETPCDSEAKSTRASISRTLSNASAATVDRENRYGNTSITGRARAVLGNVFHQQFHHHHYYNKEQSLVRREESCGPVALNQSLDTTTLPEDSLPNLISTYDPSYNLKERFLKRIPNTCEWFRRTPEYKSWLRSENASILLCTGSVGCGKSIIASTVIQTLESTFREPPRLCAHYFVDPSKSTVTTVEDILRALLKQLLVFLNDHNVQLSQEHELQIRSKLTDPKQKQPLETLIAILAPFRASVPDCLYVVDGIDALPESEIMVFLKFLRSHFAETFESSHQHKMLVFCRDTLGRGVRFDNIPCSSILRIVLENIKHDLDMYVEHEVEDKEASRRISPDPELVQRIKQVLKQNSEKMFLWIYLQIATLWDVHFLTTRQEIEDQLSSLPQGLDEVYVQCLRRIQKANNDRSRLVAAKILRWVAMAKEPLTQLQAREVVSMDPDNLPLQSSGLLNHPVTEYCANLVEVNTLNDTVRFHHHTVKEFLQDPGKVPSELSGFALHAANDDLWCGEICLAYAEIYHSRNALVRYRTQEIEQSYLSAFAKKSIQQSLPLPWQNIMLKSQTRGRTISFPLPLQRSNKGLMGESSSVHEYMCKNWLFHNTEIDASHSGFATFADLSLAYDNEIQPWISKQDGIASRHQQLVEFAIMHNHVPLLQVLKDNLRAKAPHLWQEVLSVPCLDTDLSFLHIAVALEHFRIASILSDSAGSLLANSDGKSATAVAIELGNAGSIHELIAAYPSLPVSLLMPHRVGLPKIEENLLNICAASGNISAAFLIFATMGVSLPVSKTSNKTLDRAIPFILSEALFHACKNDRREMASQLVGWGADPDRLNCPGRSAMHHISQWVGIKQQSSFLISMQLNEPELWGMLVDLGAGANPEQHCNFDQFLPYYKEPLHSEGLVDAAARLFRASIDGEIPVTRRKRFPTSKDTQNIERQLLFFFSRGIRIPYCGNWTHWLPRGNDGSMRQSVIRSPDQAFASWFVNVSDDILALCLEMEWFKPKFLVSDLFWDVLTKKTSARTWASILDGLTECMNPRALDTWKLRHRNKKIVLRDVVSEIRHLRSYHEIYFRSPKDPAVEAILRMQLHLEDGIEKGYFDENAVLFRA